VEINDKVDETDGNIERVGSLPHCPSLVVKLDDPLPKVRGVRGNHGGTGAKMRAPSPLGVEMFKH